MDAGSVVAAGSVVDSGGGSVAGTPYFVAWPEQPARPASPRRAATAVFEIEPSSDLVRAPQCGHDVSCIFTAQTQLGQE